MNETESYSSPEEEQEMQHMFALFNKLHVPADFEDGLLARLGVTEELVETEVQPPSTPKHTLLPKIPIRTTHRRLWKTYGALAASLLIAFLAGNLLPTLLRPPDDIHFRGAVSPDMQQLLVQGDRDAKSEQYASAQDAYESYLRRHNTAEDLARGLRRLAALHYRANRDAEAYEAAAAAVLLAPTDWCAYWYQGAAAFMLDRDNRKHRYERTKKYWKSAQTFGADTETAKSLAMLEKWNKTQPEEYWRPNRENRCEYDPAETDS